MIVYNLILVLPYRKTKISPTPFWQSFVEAHRECLEKLLCCSQFLVDLGNQAFWGNLGRDLYDAICGADQLVEDSEYGIMCMKKLTSTFLA